MTLFSSNFVVGLALTIYGQLLLFILPALKARNWRLLSILSAISLVALVGFSRIALGAHFLTDVLAPILFGILAGVVRGFEQTNTARQPTIRGRRHFPRR